MESLKNKLSGPFWHCIKILTLRHVRQNRYLCACDSWIFLPPVDPPLSVDPLPQRIHSSPVDPLLPGGSTPPRWIPSSLVDPPLLVVPPLLLPPLPVDALPPVDPPHWWIPAPDLTGSSGRLTGRFPGVRFLIYRPELR